MASFYDNLRASFLGTNTTPANKKLMTRGDIQKARQQENRAVREQKKEEEEYAKYKAKETAPLRSAIREASGGRILVDDSIYDKTKLERILDSVKTMQESNNGVLQPPYVVISNREMDDSDILGVASPRVTYTNKLFPFLKSYQLSPSDNYYGTKNSPYRIGLTVANDTQYNDFLSYLNDAGNWTVEKKTGGEWPESLVHAHELAHTAYFDALKKTQDPVLPKYYSREKIKEFRQTHPSLQEIFDVAARNAGYDTLQEAAATISGYALQDAENDNKKGGIDATKNWRPNYHRLPELFAEAYVDYLYNKENASNFSKEIIKLYVDYINDYNNTFDEKIALDNLFRQPEKLDNGKFVNDFIDNLRKTSSK